MIADKPKNKGSKIITREMHNALSNRVNDPKNPFLGYWDAQNWINEEFDVDIKYQRIREYLIQHFKQNLRLLENLIIRKMMKLKKLFELYA